MRTSFSPASFRPIGHFWGAIAIATLSGLVPLVAAEIGREISIARHLADGEEYALTAKQLSDFGQRLFSANWTVQEGAGRPLTKGTGAPLSDPAHPLVFPRNFNRVSGPDANSCAGCHDGPFGIPGGNGDFVANVFVLGQRFDFATFDRTNAIPTATAVDERSLPVTLQDIANSRATPGMFGAGYLEMLARQMTAELQSARDATPAGATHDLTAKGVHFGRIVHRADGSWDTSQVQGLPATSLGTTGATPPSLVIRPFHQAGRVVSLREFSNNAMNHHHGIQSTERFGLGKDPDGDGITNEMTRADMTALAVFQAAMAVPGRVIPNDPEIENAVLVGEVKFQAAGCANCHLPSLPLDHQGWLFTEPNPFNPPTNLRPGDAAPVTVDLNSATLPLPRLAPGRDGVVHVPAFADFKLHDVTSGLDDPGREALDMQQPAGSPAFFAGNAFFLTRRLWDAANKPNHFHHGLFTTLREAILAHAGEAAASRQAFQALPEFERGCVIEFLKTLQVLPPGTPHLIVDENGAPKTWPPNRIKSITLTSPTQASITWQGDTGVEAKPCLYQLQHCTDLGLADWTDVGSPTREDHASGFVLRPVEFYRVVRLTD